MEFIYNRITLKARKASINNLKSFLENYSLNLEEDDNAKCIDFSKNIDTTYNKIVIDNIQANKSSSFWFNYDWCDVGSTFFDETLEHETLYFKTGWNPSLNIIIEISKLFPKIEFNLKWYPQSIMYESFGVATVKNGEILELDTTTPQWYLDDINEMCEIGNDDVNQITPEPQYFINENKNMTNKERNEKLAPAAKFNNINNLSMNTYTNTNIELKNEWTKYFSEGNPPIKPTWASKSEFMQICFPLDEGCFMEADVKTLIEKSNFDKRKKVNSPSDIEHRHSEILRKWRSGNVIDPPYCSYANDIVDICEGNHRIALCDFLRISKILILVRINEADNIAKEFGFKLVEK